MTVFDWFQDEKGRYFYCHQKIGTAIAVIRHCIAQHPSEEVQLLWPSSLNPHVRYKTYKQIKYFPERYKIVDGDRQAVTCLVNIMFC